MKKIRINKGDVIFYISIMIVPLLQYLIFYIGVNVNSVLLSLKSYNYDLEGGTASYKFIGLRNFSNVVNDLLYSYEYSQAFKNSFISFAIHIIPMFLVVLFAYYIFKQGKMSGFFKIMLFLPSIISPLILTLLFKYFVDGAIPRFFVDFFGLSNDATGIGKIIYNGLLNCMNSRFITLQFFYILCSFPSVILYIGAMGNINASILEAADLDGATQYVEFTKIIFPLVYKTFVSLFIVNFAMIFTVSLNLYSFYSYYADYSVSTIGYKLLVGTLNGTLSDYPYYSALGVIMTLIICPMNFLVKGLLNKFGKVWD